MVESGLMRSLLLLFLLAAPVAYGSPDIPHFTTVFFDDEGVVYAGLQQADGQARVVAIPFATGERTIIPLPADAAANPVIGLVTEELRRRDPQKAKKLFVLTSMKEGPALHVFDRAANQWRAKGKLKCPSFTKVRLSSSRFTFSCEVGRAKKGKVRVQQKAISLGKDPIHRTGVWRFPEFLLRHKGRVAILEGPAPHWDTLRLRDHSENERTITAADLLKLPLPPQ